MKKAKININYLKKFLKNIRKEDKEELIYYFDKKYRKEFFKFCLNCPNYFLVDDFDNPIAIGGVVLLPNKKIKIGQIWMLCTNEYKKHKKELYKFVLDKIKIFKKEYNVLFNFIYKTNFKADLWLKKSNFIFKDLEKNKNIKLFYFTKEKDFDLKKLMA